MVFSHHLKPFTSTGLTTPSCPAMIIPSTSKYRGHIMNDKISLILRALADPTRLAVYQCIRECGGEACYDTCTGMCDGGCVGGVASCDVRCQVPCAPSTLTHHLNALRDAGLIETQKRGWEVYAHVRPDALIRIAAFFALKTK